MVFFFLNVPTFYTLWVVSGWALSNGLGVHSFLVLRISNRESTSVAVLVVQEQYNHQILQPILE